MKCCCGHDYVVHIGGPDMTEAEISDALPDGGMCRAKVNDGRCDCFNFCTCYEVTA
jgi:hypothetical protein